MREYLIEVPRSADEPTKPDATPVLALTRGIFVLGVCLTAGTGAALFAAPHRTAAFWAWTIRAPLTAAFFGAAYIGAGVALALAARTREWQRARVVAVVAFTLTSLTLLETLLEPGPFAFGDGGLTGAVAWVWLAVYITLPPLALAAFVRQERAGGAREYDVALPALGATRAAIGGAGTLLGTIGVGLLVHWAWLSAHWPWPLPLLPAGIVGAWLCTYSAGFLWFALREREWNRVRIGVLPAALVAALDLVAAGRLRNGFAGGPPSAIYVAALGLLLATLVAAAIVEERRLRHRRS